MTTKNNPRPIVLDLREEMTAMAGRIEHVAELDEIPHTQNDIARAVHNLYLSALLHNGFPVVPEGEDLDYALQNEINYEEAMASYVYDRMCEDEEDDPERKDPFFSALSERRFDLLMSAHTDICNVFIRQGIYFKDDDDERSMEIENKLALSKGLWIIQNVQ